MMISLLLACIINVFVRYLVSVHSYSGAGKGPMYGDYEAQRHWMEITTNLPINQWYFNTTSNDLLYWGLDYPPLTAYHSWLVGTMAHYIEPNSVALFSSRGYETPTSKVFGILFRLSVIISDILTYLPAVYLFVTHIYHQDAKNDKKAANKHNLVSKDCNWSKDMAALFLSMQPALLLIDHGHFQYLD